MAPNILFIYSDQHRHDVWGAAGHPVSGRMELPFGRRAIFVRDPDRNVVELDQLPEGLTREQVHARLASDGDDLVG